MEIEQYINGTRSGLKAYLEFYKIPFEERKSNGVLKFFIIEKIQQPIKIEIPIVKQEIPDIWDELNKKAGF